MGAIVAARSGAGIVLAGSASAVRRRAGRHRGLAIGALSAYVAFHVMGLFEWNFGDAEVAMLLWYTIGLSVAVGRGELA